MVTADRHGTMDALLELDAGIEEETMGGAMHLQYSTANAPRGLAALDPLDIHQQIRCSLRRVAKQ